MSRYAAAALVFVCSAAVLMIEILAGRLLAPYVGISLETYTSIIGTVLAGIAAGAWLGGKLADWRDARRLLGPTVCLGGLLALFTVPIVRALGDQTGGGGRGTTLSLAIAAFFLPALVLSAVTPMVVKLQLHDLHRTGGVVGRLSGISTFGALVGTFVTGYVLTQTIRTSTTIYVLGGTLLAVGIALGFWYSRRRGTVLAVITAVGVIGATAAASAHSPCQIESAYYCIRVERDASVPSGRILWLDNLRHSYVDLNDPTHLGFFYEQTFADVIAAAWPDHRALDALHIGGGGFTLPRYLAATRPGTRSTVLEIDGGVVALGRQELGVDAIPGLAVRVGDARTGLREQPRGRFDLVVGDAFGGLAVPWHLTTREVAEQVRDVLTGGGVYAVNVIDYPPDRFARAEVATLRSVFGHVVLLGAPVTVAGEGGGNHILVASRRPLPLAAIRDRLAGRTAWVVADERATAAFAGRAQVLTDAHAPVDQLITTFSR